MRKTIMHFLAILGTISIYAQELHTPSNAVSVNNESNSVTGWTGGSTMTADTTDPYHGTYAMKIVSTSTNTQNRRAEYSFTATNGETYDISVWAKVGSQANDPAFAVWDGLSGFSTTLISSTAWTEYTFTVTATSSAPVIRVFTGSGSGSTGDEIFIDRVSIIPQSSTDTQSPTAPTLSSTGQSDTTADFSWSGATDNIGVTGYKIFKDGVLEATLGNVNTYQATGLTASTAYNFTVTALDAANNESVVSNAVSVTTNSSGGGSSGGGSSVWSESSSVASYTGDVAVGTSTVPNGYRMAIDGKLITEEVKVQLSGNWPDYVFAKDYDLSSLEDVQKHIKEKGHLPNIPSAKEAEANGIEIGEMNRLLIEKIEELTLYILEQEERITKLESLQQSPPSKKVISGF
ncbi:hypothetical protein FVB32_16395 [Flagellimonas hymeniacidonis]|uniref:Fibronectin type-III domain-containing protein n=1 Tax=Flagellimonas hymeniacidonis TaxID=2603628 RepID=A0A5C8V6J4_9FLAO|nr:hypothetical protein [Flagellimonas hymeniacidonis]TXN36137.1 hypothetical protein FVB32_16395 [Flagellimonas hymeniacidonis]